MIRFAESVWAPLAPGYSPVQLAAETQLPFGRAGTFGVDMRCGCTGAHEIACGQERAGLLALKRGKQ